MRFLLLVLLCVPALAAEFYLAPTGQDKNAGSKQMPFLTLERARDAVRALKAKGPLAEPVVIWVRDGLHLRNATFELGADDSGAAPAPIIYRGYGSGEARLCGGRVIAPGLFTPVTEVAVLNRLDPAARGQVRQVDLSRLGLKPADLGGPWPVRFQGYAGWPELFFAGRRMTLARWPNAGFAKIEKVLDPGSKPRNDEKPDRPGQFVYSGDRPSRWTQAGDVYLKGYWCFKWYDEVIKVGSLDTAAKTITMAAPHHYGIGGPSGNLYFALNLLEELDAPGEYYLDRPAAKLYFIPPAPLAGQDILLSTLNAPLISLKGASHIRFEGLVFEASRGPGVELLDCEDVILAGCTVRNTAGEAVGIRGGANCGLQSCDLYNLGTGGVFINSGDRARLVSCNHFVDNCHIHDFIQVTYGFQAGIMLNGVGCRMSHNLIHDTPQQAMGYSGNDHQVEFNEVYDVCLDADDNGVIHQGRDWTWRGNVIRYNFFHDVPGGPGCSNNGVYLDDMECGVEVFGNVLYRIPRANLVGGGRDNMLTNNIIVDSPMPVVIDNRAMNWASYHVDTTMKGLLDLVAYKEEPWRSRYPKLVNIWEDEPATPKGNTFARNLLVRCGQPSFTKEVVQFGTIENNLETKEDPGFVDPARLDFSLRDDSPVYQQIPGFQKVHFDQIGLYVDRYRKTLPVRSPVLTPGPHAFVEAMTLTLALPRGAAGVIRYTLDGSDPIWTSPIYRVPVRLTQTTTVKAVTYPDGKAQQGPSKVVSGTYKAYLLGPGGGVYLSDLPGTDVLAHAGLKNDVNYAGSAPLSLGGHPLEKGLMLCPETTPEGGRGHVTYELVGGLARARVFKATVGIDDEVKAGSVTFAVEVFRGGKWEQLFDSGVMRPGEVKAVEVPIAGAQKLRLLTTDAGDNINSDHAVWGRARLQ